jgi:predicted hotdog family 3-hydroxylacyl-ACP dehydratase
MRSHGRLAAVCGIEFAAQAMAVHGALLEPEVRVEPRMGYLASIRSVEVYVGRLDDIDEALIASADRLGGDKSSALYRFSLHAAGQPLIEGRATLVFNLTAPSP